MPRRKSARSLARLCLENVAQNMQGVWLRDYADNYLDEYRFRYIMGPFSELAGSLVQELLHMMGHSRRLTRPMLHLLLVPHLTELSLHSCAKLVSQAIAQIITVRCKNLSSLDLHGCSRIPTDALVDLMESLPCLTKLNLSETQSNTQVLSAVGSTCRRLRELDISGCKKLSPGSLFHLAYDPVAGSSCCLRLEVLMVGEAEFSASSQDLPWVLVFLLLALPKLQLLGHSSATEAIALMHSQQFDGARIPPGFPSLEELMRHRVSALPDEASSGLTLSLKQMLHVGESSLPVVCSVCPHVAKATVFLEDAPGFSRCSLSWRWLTHLTVNCLGSLDLGELQPMVASCGTQLQSLSLGGFFLSDELSFPRLLSHCPNLREFSAAFCPTPKGASSWDQQPDEQDPAREQEDKDVGWDLPFPSHGFPSLGMLRVIFSNADKALPLQHTLVLRASLLALLKRSPRLESLDLIHLPFPLDRLFEKVLEPPSIALGHLRTLSLAQSKVSVGTIHLLFSLDNPLSHLSLDGCPDIHQRHYDELIRRVRKEALEVVIRWQ